MAQELISGSFTSELKSRYLTYALSTIMARALPDVRDGLKPVHRRLLYVMHQLRLDPDKAYKKCARVVGDVIGKYHPHGDQAVYDAMVRLAQDFAVRYPLVDGQGNFGSIDGDSPAAMRYTEARMTEVASALMTGIAEGTVDFRPNYDESEREPIVFPAAFPNLLANGSSGIAVGMSTNIPPHNVGEICDGLMAMLKKPDISSEVLHTRYIPGPDLPTGGVLAETPEALLQCYATGRGSVRLRAKWEKEDLGRGQYQIVVTEIPYQVQKSRLVEKLDEMITARKLPWLADVRDESAETIRMVLEPKSRTVDPAALMETLFKTSDLEVRVPFIMHAINSDGAPELMTLRRVLEEFIGHRRDVLVRRSGWRLDQINERLHILGAYRVVYLNIDEVIQIIKTHDEPAPVMMERFDIDQIQADAILNMRLRRLRKLEEMEIKREHDALSEEKAGLQAILMSEEAQTAYLMDEVKGIKKQFGDKRRTELASAPSAVVVPLEAQIEREPVTVLVSQAGWVKAMKGHMGADQEVKYKDGDAEAFRLTTYTTNPVCFFGTGGRVFTISAAKLPAGRGFGEPLRLMADLDGDESIAAVFDPGTNPLWLVATLKGQGFTVEAENLMTQMRTGKQVLNVDKGDSARWCLPVTGDLMAAYGKTNRLLIFPLEEVPTLQRGKGVRLMGLKGDDLVDLAIFNATTGLGLRGGPKMDRERVFTDVSLWLGKRAQVGKVPPHGFQQNLQFFITEAAAEAAAADEAGRMNELLSAMTGEQADLFGLDADADAEERAQLAEQPEADDPEGSDEA